MGADRNIAELERQDGRSYRGISLEHSWTHRADAWERHATEIRNEAAEDEIADMSRRHIQLARVLFDSAYLEAKRMLEGLENENRKLSPKEIVTLTEACTKLERLARGEPTERTESTVDVSGMTLDQLEAFRRKVLEEGK